MAAQKEIIRLYKGTVAIAFHWDDEKPEKHYYTMSAKDDKLLSVTKALNEIIAKPMLIDWAAKMACESLLSICASGIPITAEHIQHAKTAHKRHSAVAADIGKQVHKWCEQWIKNDTQPLPEDPNVRNGVMGFLQWTKEHDVQFTKSEKIVYSKKYKYVGTMDAEAMVDGKLCVIDFKTSKAVYEDMRYQVAAYRAASEEELGKIYTGNPILARFDKETGNFDHHELFDTEKDFEAFKSVLKLYRRKQEIKKYK